MSTSLIPCLLGIIVIIYDVSSNVLRQTQTQPGITATGLFVVGREKTLGCYVTTAEAVTNFPLTWSRGSTSLVASEENIVTVSGSVKNYNSFYRFVVQPSDNLALFTCTANLPSGITSATWTIHVNTTSEASQQLAPSCPYIISRAEWGAKEANPPLEPLTETPGHVYIHHGATPPDGCHSEGLCKAMVRAYQDFHQISRGWSDIAYSFLVGEDGMAYEGRGWTNVGAHTKGHNRDGLGFCVIGDFTHRAPNAAALDTLRALIQCGVDSGYIMPDFILLGHRDTAPNHTACPGDAFYPVIQTWPHYNSTT